MIFNIPKNALNKKKQKQNKETKLNSAWWDRPVIPAREAESGGSRQQGYPLLYTSSKPA